MKVAVEEILTAARVRRQKKFGRRDNSEGGSEGGVHGQRSVGVSPGTFICWDGDR